MEHKTKSIVLPVILVLVAASLLGMSVALHRNTLIDWWKPAAFCLVPACAAGFAISIILRQVRAAGNRFVHLGAGIILAFSVFLGAFYMLNFYKSDHASGETCIATVVNRYSEERHQTRRVGRNRVTQGPKYNVYFVVIELPGGKTKRLEVSPREYIHTKPGKKMELRIENGLFNVPVIKNLSPSVRHVKRF